MKHVNLGLLPAAGGGLTSLATTGQASRLLDHYFPAYLREFQHLYYFSYHEEALADYTDSPVLLERVSLVPRLRRSPYRIYAFQLPFITRPQFEACQLLRVFQATGAVPAMIARLLYGVPYVVTYGYRYHAFAAVEGRSLASFYLRLLEPVALRLAAGVIVTTRELGDYVARFIPGDRIQVIPNGVDTALFSPSQQARTRNDGVRTLLFVGRLTRQKNLMRLMKAVSFLAHRHVIRLQIIGDGPLRRELEEAAAQLQGNCVLEGTVSHRDLPHYMNQADLFVLPSFVEGHPKVLLEAMSCGMPCVVSDCEGNRSVVDHEKTGLTFSATDVRQMASQIERVLVDRDLALALGRAARDQARARYDLRKLLEQEAALLYRVATGAPR